jgi:hypothetical protein
LIAIRVGDGDDADMTMAPFSAAWFPDASYRCQTAALAIVVGCQTSGFQIVA